VSAEKCPERGQWKNQDREIAPISLPLFDQWRVRRRTGHTHRGTLHQDLRASLKSVHLFFGKMSTIL